MKNIHLLPTDKPSRLQKTKHNNFFLANRTGYEYTDCTAQHIYITSDEEIKEGWKGYAYKEDVTGKVFKHFYTTNEWYKDAKKIILTTDQDLIKDGVQAIDDEFLEWFVKNPSCEQVEVEKVPYDGTKSIDKYWGGEYKIIIPKEEPNPFELPKALPDDVFYKSLEEPKQESPEEPTMIDDWLNEYGDPEIYKKVEREAILKYGEPKQETPEEAAERLYPNGCDGTDRSAEIYRRIFIAGAKWQQERMYSEEDLREAYFSAIKSTGEGRNGEYTGGNNPNIEEEFGVGFETWFEQFKKKQV